MHNQTLFRRLAVFAGALSLEAAQAVSRTDRDAQPDLLDSLASLVRAGLLVPQKSEAEPRFAMLQTIRDFARERLQAAGELDSSRFAHAAFYLDLAEVSEPWLRGSEQRHCLDRLEAEIDNFREALRFFHERGEVEPGLRLASALQWFWWDRGYLREGQEWLTRFLALEGNVSPSIRARALNGASYLASSCGVYETAMALSAECLEIVRGAGDREGIAWALAYRAAAEYRRGDVVAARTWGEQSLEIFRELGLPEGMLFAAGYVGLAMQDQGDDAAAYPLLAEAVDLARQLGDRDNLSRALLGLGFIALYHRAATETARDYFRESLAVSAELGHPYPLIYSLEGLAGVAAAEARPARALRLSGAASALREARHAVPAPQLLARYQQAIEAVREALPEAAQHAAWSEGRAMTESQAIAYALADTD